MSSRAIIAKVVLKDVNRLDEFLAAYEKLHTYSNTSEPETLLYELHQSRDDERTFCIIERFVSDFGVDSHAGSPYRRRFDVDIQKLASVESLSIEVYNAVDHPLLNYTQSPERVGKGICVFAGSVIGKNASQHISAANSLAVAIVKRNRTMVYCGGTLGLNGIIAKDILQKKGRVITVIPAALKPHQISGNMLGSVILTRTLGERKNAIFSLSDTIIFLPGGIETFNQLLDVLTLSAVNAYRPKIGILNPTNFFGPFFALLNHLIAQGYVEERIVDFFVVENSIYADKLLLSLESFVPPPPLIAVGWPNDKEF